METILDRQGEELESSELILQELIDSIRLANESLLQEAHAASRPAD